MNQDILKKKDMVKREELWALIRFSWIQKKVKSRERDDNEGVKVIT